MTAPCARTSFVVSLGKSRGDLSVDLLFGKVGPALFLFFFERELGLEILSGSAIAVSSNYFVRDLSVWMLVTLYPRSKLCTVYSKAIYMVELTSVFIVYSSVSCILFPRVSEFPYGFLLFLGNDYFEGSVNLSLIHQNMYNFFHTCMHNFFFFFPVRSVVCQT